MKEYSEHYIKKMNNIMKSTSSLYNEHIYAISHEIRTPLAIINSCLINELNNLKYLYYSIDKSDYNINIIKKIKDNILIIEEQVYNIENFITKVSEHNLYINSNNDYEYLLINIKNYLDNLLYIAPSFSRSMKVFSDNNISYGDLTGDDFDNIHVIVNPQEFNHIIMNIIINSAEAIESKLKYVDFEPKLKISCLKCNNPNEYILLNSKKIYGPVGDNNLNCQFYIIIEDNGPGIDKIYLDHIFKYGFSTKKDKYNKNLGFGLHICSQLAKKNNLSIFINTKPNFGSKFFIGFPNMVIAKSGTLTDKFELKNIYQKLDDFNMLSFSGYSKQIYNEFVNDKNIKKYDKFLENKSVKVFKKKKN